MKITLKSVAALMMTNAARLVSASAASVENGTLSKEKQDTYELGYFNGPAYGQVRAVTVQPACISSTVIANCQANGF